MRQLISFVLGGGRGTRLYPLTKYRSKPAVPLAAKYRLIDIPLSNCLNSGMNQIYVLTQFLSVSLHRHIRRTYQFDNFSGGFVELLAAQQTMETGTDWYQGTADAVRKNIRYLDSPEIDYVLILSGDQLYHMDYREMLRTHRENDAEVTIAALPVNRAEARSLGVMRANDDGRITGFLEKPQTDEEIDLVRMDPEWITRQGIPSHGRDCLASMGIYLFNRSTLLEALEKTTYEDFGREVFPEAIRTRRVHVHMFDGYWEDIGTIRSFYEANLALASQNPPFNIASAESPIYSRARYLPPSRFDEATIRNSLIADGCRIAPGAVIENSVIGLRCIVGEGTTIRNSVVMGADAYESRAALRDDASHGWPPIGIGSHGLIDGAIVDKNCHIGDGVKIHADASQRIADNDLCVLSDGIPVVMKNAVIPSGWSLDHLPTPE